MKRGEGFQTIKTEGAILPPDFLLRIADGNRHVPGLRAEDYHLAKSERLNEVAARAWSRVLGAWGGFKASMETLEESDAGTSLTREKWTLILFQELGYGRLTTRKAYDVEERSYPISHSWQKTPIHLTSFRLDLDKRVPGVRGASRVSPHSLVQELLSRSDEFLWGFVSNGLCLRLLRDNVSLTRQSYVEFDLQAMMDSEAYSDFFLLFLLCHQSRVEVAEDKGMENCWLEKWYCTAAQLGVRALDQLRDGVKKAIEAFGSGFLAHPANDVLRKNLCSGGLSKQDYYRQILRQVYRLLFLFVAEDREVLLDPLSPPQSRKLYTDHYSTQRLRELASKMRASRHADMWHCLRLVFSNLQIGCKQLGLPAFGGFLFSDKATSDLSSVDISNIELIKAIRALAFTVSHNILRPINYRNLGSEELGSVYESLLEMQPEIHIQATAPEDRFRLTSAVGSERKTTGSYYTPTSLVNCLLDSALEPVLRIACKKPEPEKALLALKVCDPACGSGHFLIAAAHRIAKRLAAIRAREDEPSPEYYQHALRDVISHSIYGVDINHMSVELCKVSLWMEAMEAGRPLTFLDHHIKCGNSLFGTTPALLKNGIPDKAFELASGDDDGFCKKYKNRNQEEQERSLNLFNSDGFPWEKLNDLRATIKKIDGLDDTTLDAMQNKEKTYSQFFELSEYQYGRLYCDAWCAAFVWEKHHSEKLPYPITQTVLDWIRSSPNHCLPWLHEEIIRLSKKYQFFHWHLEFPDVFTPKIKGEITTDDFIGWLGGFDCVLGNPPWERVKLQEKEFFAERSPEIANTKNIQERDRMIANLSKSDPALHQALQNAQRISDDKSGFFRNSGRYPLCGRGDVNTYSIFAELKQSLLDPSGQVGCIVPLGIATDNTTRFFFQNIMETGALVSLKGFENEEFIFPAVHHATKFCLLTITAINSGADPAANFVFFARQVEHLAEKERQFLLTASDITLLNPNTRTCPIFRCKHDAELAKFIYKRTPVLIRDHSKKHAEENPWGISFQRMIGMDDRSGIFRNQSQLEDQGCGLEGNTFISGQDKWLPLYEGKMFWQYDHRFGTAEGQTQAQSRQGKLPELTSEHHENPEVLPLPLKWVAEKQVKARIPQQPKLLAKALSLPEKVRSEVVGKLFNYWIAGYWRNAGHENRAKKLLEEASEFSLNDTQTETLSKWMIDDQCAKMQERYPLSQDDVSRMTSSSTNHIALAEELLDRFSPQWLVAFRRMTSSVSVRTMALSALPRIAVGDNSALVYTVKTANEMCCIIAAMNSFPLDYVARQGIGGNSMGYFIMKQLPVMTIDIFRDLCPWDEQITLQQWITSRVLELSYTAWDMMSMGSDCKYDGPPFVWSEKRRHTIRAELDAAFFHLYLGHEKEWVANGSKELLAYFPTPRCAVTYIMDTFRIQREREEVAHGKFKTKETILEIFDEMNDAIRDNSNTESDGHQQANLFQSQLEPMPGPPMDAGGNFISMTLWNHSSWPINIHPPRGEAQAKPAKVSLSKFIDMAYPGTDTDKAICSTALAVVEQCGEISSFELFSAVLLAMHPNWCKAFLDRGEQNLLEDGIKITPSIFLIKEDQPIQWKKCRDYLEKIHAISVCRKDNNQYIKLGLDYTTVNQNLPDSIENIIGCAIAAIKRMQLLRNKMPAISKKKAKIIKLVEESYNNYSLAS